jgi:hypothetical protein
MSLSSVLMVGTVWVEASTMESVADDLLERDIKREIVGGDEKNADKHGADVNKNAANILCLEWNAI